MTGLSTFGPSLKAGGTISPSVFVKLSTTTDSTVVQCVGADAPFGISQEGVDQPPGLAGSDGMAGHAGEDMKVYGPGSTCMLVVGAGGINPGDKLKPDASGNGITTVTANDLYGAIALEAGAAGTKAKVYVWQGKV